MQCIKEMSDKQMRRLIKMIDVFFICTIKIILLAFTYYISYYYIESRILYFINI